MKNPKIHQFKKVDIIMYIIIIKYINHQQLFVYLFNRLRISADSSNMFKS